MEWIKPREVPLVEEKSPQELKREYKELCADAGDKQFQITKLQAQVYMLNEKLFKLQEIFEQTDKKIKGMSAKDIQVPQKETETIHAP